MFNVSGVKYSAAMGIWRLLTENIPQAALSIWFAHEMKPSALVYVSCALSIITGLKGFAKGALRIGNENYEVIG